MGIFSLLEEARARIDEGEQGAARALLVEGLAGATSATGADEACALAEATGLLIGLDVEIEQPETIDRHLERLAALTDGVDDERTAEALAYAELPRIEFVHGLDDVDPVLHVEVLQRAVALDARWRDSPHAGVRRAAAEAALTAQMIRKWLGQSPSSIAVALDELALRLGGEADPRSASIRLEAMFTASRLRVENDLDLSGVPEVLDLVVREARSGPGSAGFALDAALLLADIAIAEGAPALEAVAPVRRLLADGLGEPGVQRARRETRHLEEILDRLDGADRDAVAAEEWSALLGRYAADADADARALVLSDLLRHVGATAYATASGLALLREADRVFLSDDDPRSALARFGVAARIASVLGHPDGATAAREPSSPERDPVAAVAASLAVEERFAAFWDDVETVPKMAALLLDRALRQSDLGGRDDALSTLARLSANVRATGRDIARSERVQAGYWESRFLREAGRQDASRKAIDEVLAEFSADPSGDVRRWAANALWSAWRSDLTGQTESRELRRLFAERFADDPDVRIRRLDATRMLGDAVESHEQGSTGAAIDLLRALDARFGDADDDDTQDTVRRARENLRILSLLPGADAASGDAATERYRSLRDRLYAADELAEKGRVAEAEGLWRGVVEESAGTDDVDVAMLRLAALDAWAGWLQDAKYWEQVATLARQATVIRAGSDLRAERVQARAYLRLGMALGALGDPRGAIAAYEALDALAEGETDGELATTRQQGVYNRAIMIDEIGDVAGALAAYEHVVAVHGQSVDTASGRLRCAKALRNQAILFGGLGRTAEAAGAHRRVLDIGAGTADADLEVRVRASAFDLAGCFAALGDHASEAATYAWIRSAPHLGLSAAEVRSAARAEKVARRRAR
ncbi:hypothetical protein [Microbacterium sp. LWH10-1.2]|uniref:hypothetical protein n=1 Tax=Microbacterium sp. LWH10-1.2 TaxID=3135255 RepID=UPI0031388025